MALEKRFSFGDNWIDFVENSLDQQRIEAAVLSVKTMLGVDSLRGKTFLDIGCGSGLFSLAAYLLNAEKIFSFDYDEKSVEATKLLCSKFSVSDSRWEITTGNILEKDWVDKISRADVVYSWGVLHHTGKMWQALENSMQKVNPNGLFALSIYNRVETPRDSSSMWWKIKKKYNESPTAIKEIMVWLFILKVFQRYIRDGKNPIHEIKQYGERGMDFLHDARDWIGGFPYEYASTEEIINFMAKFKNFELIFINPKEGNGCNEYVFKNTSI